MVLDNTRHRVEPSLRRRRPGPQIPAALHAHQSVPTRRRAELRGPAIILCCSFAENYTEGPDVAALLAASTLHRERTSNLRGVIPLVDHDGALELDDRLPLLVVACGFHHHYRP